MSWEAQFNQFKQHHPLESSLAAQARNSAFEDFAKVGLPTKKLEAWKYTSLTDFKNINWDVLAGEEKSLTHEQMQFLSNYLPSDFTNFVLVNGLLNKTLSDDLSSEIEISEVTKPDLVLPEDHVESGLAKLAQSFLYKKIVFTVPKNRTLAKPVQFVFVNSSESHLFSSEKLELVLEENSEAQILLHSISFANQTGDALNLSIDVQVKSSARLKLLQLQNEDHGSFHFSQNQIHVESKASVQQMVLTTGNGQSRNYLELDFKGENAQAEVYGVSVLAESQVTDNYTFIRHSKGANQSVQHYKSLLGGGSESSFRGRVRIEPNAQKANSEQLNNNLLLTREAKANSVPQLEIYADDVKAGHGSTMGQLSQDEIFYFLSRGISQAKAIRLLSFGFAQECIFKIENQLVRDFAIKILGQKLESMMKNV